MMIHRARAGVADGFGGDPASGASSALAFFVPYAVPIVVAAIMWGFFYSPEL